MHWIFVGIMIWIGLAIAPAVLSLAIVVIPFIIGAFIGGLGLGLLTQSAGGALIGAIIGGILPYILMNKS